MVIPACCRLNQLKILINKINNPHQTKAVGKAHQNWNQCSQKECERFNLPYFNMSDDFDQGLKEVESLLTSI